MNFLDILILLICLGGLIFFFFDRIKFSNKTVYQQKKERFFQLQKLINNIKSENEEAEILIQSLDFDDFTDSITDKLIKYRDNEDKLEICKAEYKKIESYLKNARPYIK